MNFVLDCSVTITWLFDHESTEDTDGLLGKLFGPEKAVVPQHWVLEVGNVLLGAERLKKKTPADTTLFLNLLSKLAIESDVHTEHHATTTTLALGRRHHLSSYDAAYLELAMRLGLPLATLDRSLRKAAQAEGILVLPVKISR
ncbi:MAG: type II toxin-antitoxin system VapC family toxin [Nitrospira sp.]|nr:type II toxin-antitoxin system VapC family toxin [Nitrospira sp.]MDH4305467.1 type II toxin-antitoxin system VapC family toxin [Nitrospira sp.]